MIPKSEIITSRHLTSVLYRPGERRMMSGTAIARNTMAANSGKHWIPFPERNTTSPMPKANGPSVKCCSTSSIAKEFLPIAPCEFLPVWDSDPAALFRRTRNGAPTATADRSRQVERSAGRIQGGANVYRVYLYRPTIGRTTPVRQR